MINDLIKRSNVTRTLKRQAETIIHNGVEFIRKDAALELVAMSPKAKPEEVTGVWNIRKKELICSGEHGCYQAMYFPEHVRIGYYDGKLPEYCAHCGLRMKGGV